MPFRSEHVDIPVPMLVHGHGGYVVTTFPFTETMVVPPSPKATVAPFGTSWTQALGKAPPGECTTSEQFTEPLEPPHAASVGRTMTRIATAVRMTPSCSKSQASVQPRG